ncbi:two-component sensor histidine kinase [Hymenobacter qilianensis]|uniref:Two-component sensor histidine kinase n=2 Tax=Hymenobacter qilianensis TaxID=1385715 RepID=A0ACB5PS54_9BACT|nr:ATP-binding protein [Hymenobacter qilianensis]QNP52368.1 HAMP domain-containing protein [Hymenobacter qilianensis]GGF66990.1 two-component sensor histidine kinase [Hymenobacter qilianensis]
MLIRNKLILRFTLLVLAIQLSFSAFVYYFHAASREQRFTNRLTGKAALSGRMLIKRGSLSKGFFGAFRRRDLLTLVGEQVSIYGPGGRLLYLSSDTISQAQNMLYLSRITPEKPVHFATGRRETVGLLYEHEGRAYRIFTSGIDEFGWAQLEKLRLILLVGNVGALVLIILAGWYFADESLKPISRVVRQVEKITASSLSQRVDEGNQRDEIAQLAITFNQMLAGLEQAFESQKSFLAHASHQLRTPLANLLGTLETSLDYDATLADTRQSLRSGIEEVRHLVELTNGLLALAKADSGLLPTEPVRLDECVAQALDYARAKCPDRDLRLEFGPLPTTDADVFMVPGNAQLLTTAIFNLLDNACKYSQASVTVSLGYADAQTLEVRVTDTGIGIAPHEIRRVFEPLYRAANGTAQPGYGLGLALTQKIVQLHGGQITLVSVLNQGSTVGVWLPAVAE